MTNGWQQRLAFFLLDPVTGSKGQHITVIGSIFLPVGYLLVVGTDFPETWLVCRAQPGVSHRTPGGQWGFVFVGTG